MARPVAPMNRVSIEQVSGNRINGIVQGRSSRQDFALGQSAAVYRQGRTPNPKTDRYVIAKAWQIEAYRHVNICGEARYAANLFANTASRAEIGITEANTLKGKPVFITSGPEVDALNELAPTPRDKTRLIRAYMLHNVIAGESYLIARDRLDTDPGYVEGKVVQDPIWEIVAVTEIRRHGTIWSVKHDNGNWIDLRPNDPVLRMWNPDPVDRREAWSPFRSLLPVLREIEWETKHIFTQVRSRLMSAGVWFIPNNLTFPAPPADAVEGGQEAIDGMNDAEQFMISLAAASMQMLDHDEPAYPTVVMGDEAALTSIDQNKLIQFWSQIDSSIMLLRNEAIRRFALGMDLPPEEVLGSTGLTSAGGQGNGGGTRQSVNHWGMWANQEQTIQTQIEPALDEFMGFLTTAFLWVAVPGTDKIVGYDTASLRLRQDLSQSAFQWWSAGGINLDVALRESGFNPETDKMTGEEKKEWYLTKLAGSAGTPEQLTAALELLGIVLPTPPSPPDDPGAQQDTAPGLPGRNNLPSPKALPRPKGKPVEDHNHQPAPYDAELVTLAAAEGLVLRALEKAGNRLLNDGKRGRDRDRTTPPHLAHLAIEDLPPAEMGDFDFSMIATVFNDMSAMELALMTRKLGRYCADLYNDSVPYNRATLKEAISA